MAYISLDGIFLAAIAIFSILTLVAFGSSLVLKNVLDHNDGSCNIQMSASVKKTFTASLIVTLLLIYYYLSVSA